MDLEEINPQNTNWVDTSEVHEKLFLGFLFFLTKRKAGYKMSKSREVSSVYWTHFSVVELTGLEQGLEQCRK